ncbi:cysteine--tRNA ligase 2, cytoplasmic-like isoform X2 [Magnolia sinica]|uniref:cysteine--tRNA ligase 2, cytoplasmic-like isoform X2 n=1 Tax=Magnolia sinica TaxID=86752 RepID=UPI00265ACF49|nr:cysteine--tRNA ligase 2, cytoplasmic-like isoform X2 [Magnolia sinica]
MGNPEFRIFNTMTKQMEVFKPKIPGKVGMYVCGVTAYDFSHVGHARAYVAFDLLYRYLQHLGYEVNYVRNFTDVDDKIIRRANELGVDPLSLSRRFSKEFLDDMADLQCLPPTHEPRVSDHMSQIKDMIVQIIHNGCAYVVDGDVYFSVDKFSGYGRLSGRKLEDNQAGARVAIDPRKKHLADFALWKSAKPGEPSWDSPWGPGRPGWHIECSAMSSHYLSPSFDIHGGGMDLIFPHHENEIAQSCAACSASNVSYWMHNGFVTVNNGKMSKSQGNFLTIREVFKLYHPLALRYFLISTHYQSTVNYSIKQLEEASNKFFDIYQALYKCEMAFSPFREESLKDEITPDIQKCIDKFRTDFQNSMANDLNTHDVVKVLLEDVLKAIKTVLDLLEKNEQQPWMIQSLIALEKEVKSVLTILGLMSSSTYSEVLSQLKDKALNRAGLTEEQLLQVIEERTSARHMKDYTSSDLVRDVLSSKGGIMLMDLPDGTTTWRPCVLVDRSDLTGVQLLELIEETVRAKKKPKDSNSDQLIDVVASKGILPMDSTENKEA